MEQCLLKWILIGRNISLPSISVFNMLSANKQEITKTVVLRFLRCAFPATAFKWILYRHNPKPVSAFGPIAISAPLIFPVLSSNIFWTSESSLLRANSVQITQNFVSMLYQRHDPPGAAPKPRWRKISLAGSGCPGSSLVILTLLRYDRVCKKTNKYEAMEFRECISKFQMILTFKKLRTAGSAFVSENSAMEYIALSPEAKCYTSRNDLLGALKSAVRKTLGIGYGLPTSIWRETIFTYQRSSRNPIHICSWRRRRAGESGSCTKICGKCWWHSLFPSGKAFRQSRIPLNFLPRDLGRPKSHRMKRCIRSPRHCSWQMRMIIAWQRANWDTGFHT